VEKIERRASLIGIRLLLGESFGEGEDGASENPQKWGDF
jgi:hypothetical protein